MNILLLGNGFDLYHHFPTRYDNFLHTVDFLQQYYDEDTMNHIGSIFGDKRLQDSDSYIPYCYDIYKEAYDKIELDKVKISEINKLARDNIWFKYFKISYNKELGWIDFEKEIARVVDAFGKFFYSCDDIEDVDLPDEKDELHIINNFNFFYDFKDGGVSGRGRIKFGRYIIAEQYRLEEPFASGNFLVDKSKIISKLFKELLELSEMLRLYLDIFVEKAISDLITQGLIKFNKVFRNAHTVITFNYTESFEKLYSCSKIFHIHGITEIELFWGLILIVTMKIVEEIM